MQPKLGILAGGGNLPSLIIESCRATGRDFFVVAFKGQANPDVVTNTQHVWLRLGAAGKAIKLLKSHSVEEIVMAGAVSRPSIFQLRPDMWTAKFLTRTSAFSLGDDGILRAITRELEEKQGFRIVSPESLVAGLVAPLGAINTHQVQSRDQADIRAAVKGALELGLRDEGQAAVARYGELIALEDVNGTDALLKRVERLVSDKNLDEPAGVLVKVAKPQQERRIDLPTIGVKTVEGAAAAKLRGIIIEADRSLIIDQAAVAALADRLGVFIIAISSDEVYRYA